MKVRLHQRQSLRVARDNGEQDLQLRMVNLLLLLYKLPKLRIRPNKQRTTRDVLQLLKYRVISGQLCIGTLRSNLDPTAVV